MQATIRTTLISRLADVMRVSARGMFLALAALFMFGAHSTDASAQTQKVTEWGWPQPYEKISGRSVQWLQDKGWWPLTIAWQPAWPGQNTIELVMERHKMLEKRGVNAKWQSFASGPAINEVVVTSRVQIAGGGNFPVSSLIDKRIPVTGIALGTPNLTHALLVPNDSKIRSIKDLKGSSPPATIGVVTGSSGEFYIQTTAKLNGLEIGKDLILKNMPPAEQMLMAKGLTGVVSWDPTVTMMTDERKNARIVDSIYPYNIYGALFYVRNELVENVPDVVQAYTDALVEASLWIRLHPDEALKITAEAPDLKNFSNAVLAGQIKDYNNFYKPTYLYPHPEFWGEVNEGILTWLYDAKRLTRPLTRKDFSAIIEPKFMAKTFEKIGWAIPKQPVFMPANWPGDPVKPPYPPYLTKETLKAPQQFPETGDLTKPWSFGGKSFQP